MNAPVGDALLVLRRASGITQEDLAARVGITQAALSRYENDLRDPDEQTVGRLADALGVTSAFVQHGFRLDGAVAADAHMRRQRTAKPSDWKRVEARLNLLRMHLAYVTERVPMQARNQVIHVDPEERDPSEAAAMLRASWRMPIGPVRGLVRWVESAGVVVVEEDLGTHRIDGMSQWAGTYAVVLLNSRMPTDRTRWTLAHELGHLVLHTSYVDVDLEDQAHEFAAEFLTPAHVVKPELTSLSVGKFADLKVEWGVSMQSLVERAGTLGRLSATERANLYRQFSARGWRTREPNGDLIPPEKPELAASIGGRLRSAGLGEGEIRTLLGLGEEAVSPFLPPARALRSVQV